MAFHLSRFDCIVVNIPGPFTTLGRDPDWITPHQQHQLHNNNNNLRLFPLPLHSKYVVSFILPRLGQEAGTNITSPSNHIFVAKFPLQPRPGQVSGGSSGRSIPLSIACQLLLAKLPGEGWLLELQTKVRENLIIAEKAPTKIFSWLKVHTSGFYANQTAPPFYDLCVGWSW